MKIISVINQKGGVAKTLTASNLACALTKMGKNVLAVDLDPQGSLSIVSGLYGPDGEGDIDYEITTYHVLCEGVSIEKAALEVNYGLEGNLFMIPADIELEGANVKLNDRTNPNNALKSALLDDGLKKYIDYVIIDCPPSLNRLTINALYCSDGIVVPCTPCLLAYKALSRLFDTVEGIQEENKSLEIIGIIPTIVEVQRTKHQKYLEKMKSLNVPVLEAVPKRALAEESSDMGVPVVLNRAGSDIGRAYYKIAEYLTRKYE